MSDTREYNSENDEVTKFTLRLGPEAMKTLRELKKRRGAQTFTEVFRHAIATEKFLFDRQDEGDEIILENRNTGRQRIFDLR
jgi:Ribbon-helix-helix protein, copG family